MSNNKDNWTMKRYAITLTGKQSNIILRALVNESSDAPDSDYETCYYQFAAKLAKAGFWDIPKGVEADA